MLNLWKHPKTKAVRLYLAPKVINSATKEIAGEWDPKGVKAWIQESGKTWALKVSVTTDSPVPATETDALKRTRLSQAGLSGAEPWGGLMDMASVKSARPNVKKPSGGRPAPSASVSRAQESANLDVASIQMVGSITIEVDQRESPRVSEILATHPDITVARVALDLADFRIVDKDGNELLIERKRCIPTESSPGARGDFETSIFDGHLFDQSERLKLKAANSESQIIPVFLIAGDAYQHSNMLVQQIDGALSFLSVIQKITVLCSYDENHTAYLIAKMGSHFVDGLYTPVSFHKAKPKAIWDQRRYVLEALPGVSCGIAEALLERFGSIKGVATATEQELSAVKGIGPKRIKEIMRVINELD